LNRKKIISGGGGQGLIESKPFSSGRNRRGFPPEKRSNHAGRNRGGERTTREPEKTNLAPERRQILIEASGKGKKSSSMDAPRKEKKKKKKKTAEIFQPEGRRTKDPGGGIEGF